MNLVTHRQVHHRRLLPQRLQRDPRLQRRLDLPSRLLRHRLRLSRRSRPRSNQAAGPKTGGHFNRKLLLDVGWPSLLALVGMTFAAPTVGHVFGGPEDDRTGLAIACATRHAGIAMIVAASVPGPRTAVVFVAYLIAAAVVSIPYLRGRQRKQTVTA
jgi:hypothetical protein